MIDLRRYHDLRLHTTDLHGCIDSRGGRGLYLHVLSYQLLESLTLKRDRIGAGKQVHELIASALIGRGCVFFVRAGVHERDIHARYNGSSGVGDGPNDRAVGCLSSGRGREE